MTALSQMILGKNQDSEKNKISKLSQTPAAHNNISFSHLNNRKKDHCERQSISVMISRQHSKADLLQEQAKSLN